jgi:hypothetical protein
MSPDPNFYQLLARRGLARSQRDYSSYWLCMAENYACLRGDRPPSERAQINLFRRLWSERHYLLAIRVATALLWGRQSDG